MRYRDGIFAFTMALLTVVGVLAHGERAQAGPRVGNGGGIWLCRDQTTFEIRWTKLIDFFEASAEYGLKVSPVTEKDEWKIYDAKLAQIRKNAPKLAALLDKHDVKLREILHFTPGNGALAVINDGFYRVRPDLSSCDNGYIYFGQMANYTDDGRLLVAGALWYDPTFSFLDRAGLLIHERVYKALREEFGDRNSARARAIVALVFAELPAGELAKRVETVLAHAASAEEEGEVANAPTMFACGAKLESPARGGKVERRGQMLARSGLKLATRLDEFGFRVLTDGIEGSPTVMEIIDLDTGIKAQLDANLLASAFQNNQPIALNLNGKGRRQATLTCWTEQHWDEANRSTALEE